MKLEITGKKENILLKRDEVSAELQNEGPTPSRKIITSEAAKKLGIEENLVIVDKISTERGKRSSRAKLLVYKKKEDIPKDKLLKMEKRIGETKKEGADSAPAS